MGFLATADLQGEWQNLDLCEKAWNEVLSICKKRHLKVIVFCGDGKEAYDPVSIRVIKFWQWAIRKARKAGIDVHYLMGNHDRISTYSEAGSWLSIIRNAGAYTYEVPTVVEVDGRRFFFLPFAKVKTIRKWADELLKHKPNKEKDILFFHANLLEARYSQHGKQSDSTLSIEHLHADRYRYCIGGDIHLPQKMENVYYTGSPFCCEWGEVNQRKRYLVVGKNDIRSVHSQIPRWYDPSVDGFDRSKPKQWTGARLRISVSCNASENYERRLSKARRRAERQYPGAELYMVPKFRSGDSAEGNIRSSDTDERKIKEYIRETRQVKSVEQELALEYMLEKLSHFGHGLRTGSRFKFKWAKAKNYLSYEKLKVDFTEKGIVVVKGVNQDRGNKSNGSGKTSLTNLIPVAWFGRTFKGQSHDRWSNRFHPKDQATVEICGTDAKGRDIRVLRGRRPTELMLTVNGHNESSGMKTTDSSGTQASIEQVTGFTWSTLANAVYIDRTISDAFLSGTNAQRTAVLSRFQNLERFEKALKLVKKDISENNEKYQQAKELLASVRGRIEECAHSLKEMNDIRNIHIDMMYKGYKQHKTNYKMWKERRKQVGGDLEKKEKWIEDRYNRYLKKQTELEKEVNVLEEVQRAAEKIVARWNHLKEKSHCPTCYQDLSEKAFAIHMEKAKHESKKAGYRLAKAEKALTKARQTAQVLEGKFDEIQSKLTHLDEDGSHLRLNMRTARERYRELASNQHSAYTVIGKTRHALKRLKREKRSLKKRLKTLDKRRMLYEYSEHAFSRDGIPAFLNRNLCPVLNRASDYYAELFSDKEVQVRFTVEGGEFVPQIINARGGERIKDQSEGELALAGLISSFALREAAPETNLLVLDEPGNGLDPQTARQFARSLKVLVKRFKLILVTTHNENIASALEGERTITVRKHHGISRVE